MFESMLQFNPYFRPSAKELVNHPYFDDIRQPEIKEYVPKKIIFQFDTDSSFDLKASDFAADFDELNAYLVSKVNNLNQAGKILVKKNDS